MLNFTTVILILILTIYTLCFTCNPKLDKDKETGDVFLWYNWFGKRKYIKL